MLLFQNKEIEEKKRKKHFFKLIDLALTQNPYCFGCNLLHKDFPIFILCFSFIKYFQYLEFKLWFKHITAKLHFPTNTQAHRYFSNNGNSRIFIAKLVMLIWALKSGGVNRCVPMPSLYYTAWDILLKIIWCTKIRLYSWL